MPTPANIINHIVLVLDASSSMSGVSRELVKVADNQIAYLAQRSQELDQETRITVYSFANRQRVDCLIYDKDVLRVPSIAEVYRPAGMTALIDGTLLALNDLAMTPEKYGDHSFLVYVLTDGMENDSRARPHELSAKIASLPDHWTIAAFVPDQTGVYEAKRFGFPAQNIAVWDTTARGIDEVGLRIRETTETFMQARGHARATGTTFRGTRSLFTLKDPNLREVQRNLTPLQTRDFRLYPVGRKCRIDEFVNNYHRDGYRVGKAFYELSKREKIQPQKQIAIKSNRDGMVYAGREARDLLGLPHDHVTVSPNDNPDYKVFVQSTSVNRNLMPDTELLVLT